MSEWGTGCGGYVKQEMVDGVWRIVDGGDAERRSQPVRPLTMIICLHSGRGENPTLLYKRSARILFVPGPMALAAGLSRRNVVFNLTGTATRSVGGAHVAKGDRYITKDPSRRYDARLWLSCRLSTHLLHLLLRATGTLVFGAGHWRGPGALHTRYPGAVRCVKILRKYVEVNASPKSNDLKHGAYHYHSAKAATSFSYG